MIAMISRVVGFVKGYEQSNGHKSDHNAGCGIKEADVFPIITCKTQALYGFRYKGKDRLQCLIITWVNN